MASPEGHGDDRSKYIRYARAAARLAEWRRDGIVSVTGRPAFYRLTQTIDVPGRNDALQRTALLAVADLEALCAIEQTQPSLVETRLRLLEATRTTFEPAIALYEGASDFLRDLPASSETLGGMDRVEARLETIDDPDAVQTVVEAFEGRTLAVVDGVEGVEAARAFRISLGTREVRVPEDGAFVALVSSTDTAFTRLPVHRVLRRLPVGMDRAELLARLAKRFHLEEHHNRNLAYLLDSGEGAFGLATEGGLGYLLKSFDPLTRPSALLLHEEILQNLLGVPEREAFLYFVDPVQAIRTVDEGAAAGFILPRGIHEDVNAASRGEFALPYRSAITYPAVPTGLVFWGMGDDA